MYLKKITLENVGPIDNLTLEPSFSDEGNPRPLILVGENGSGKSILLSYVVNGLLVAQQAAYEDTEVENGKVYKLRSADYISTGKTYTFGKIEFGNEFNYFEWLLSTTKSQFEEQLEFTPIHKEWNQIPADENNFFFSNFHNQPKKVEEEFNKNVVLFFPPNRFEEPAWLNIHNLNAKAEFVEKLNIKGFSNRRIITTSPLHLNKNWLLDILFDRNSFEIQIQTHQIINNGQTIIRDELFYSGPSNELFNAVISLLKLIVRKDGDLYFGIDKRQKRKVAVMLDKKPFIPNIFQMSTGETALLNLFLSILRDFDATGQTFNSFNDVSGIVVVDEIDLHLHSIHQRTILPELIKTFPKVQFIITTHSPLFVLGLENVLGQDGFSLIQMPQGLPISAEQFSEFEPAYLAFRASKKFADEITAAVINSQRPILFVEGDYDIQYLNKAALLLGQTGIIDAIEIKDGGGYGNLDKVWKHFDSKLAEITPQKILLLYDCDINRTEGIRGINVIRKVMPNQNENPIEKGIENLFNKETLEKVILTNPNYIDIIPEHTGFIRGENQVIPECWSINDNKKKNLCNWLCGNGNAEDFSGFEKVFEIISKVLIEK
jgi:hypothetical protein